MHSITLSLGVLGGVLILLLSPVYGLIVYVAALVWYPTYLSVKVGTFDFSLCRILILVIYLRCFFAGSFHNFKFTWLDGMVIFYFIAQLFAGSFTTPLGMLLENRSGAIISRMLPYFAVRLVITNKDQYMVLLKGILCVAASMAVVAFYESLTGHNPFGFMNQYRAWVGREGLLTPRMGFHRASTTFSHPIMMGLFFAFFGPICAGLLKDRSRMKYLWMAGVGLMGLGVFSSMSSGAFLAAIIAGAMIAFYRFRRYWKPVLGIILILCLTVEIISNRHFYDVLGRMALSSSTAWYRSRLIDVALFEGGMSGHWLLGYGLGVDPGWGPLLDMRAHTDMVNHYLKVLCQFGLTGLIPFLLLLSCATRGLICVFKKCDDESDRWLIWCLGGTVTGALLSILSVSLYGQSVTVLYMMIGLCGVMGGLTQKKRVFGRRVSQYRTDMPGLVQKI